jgi:hypothetical protein
MRVSHTSLVVSTLLLLFSSLALADWGVDLSEFPARVSHHSHEALHPALSDRAGLLFRSLDKDFDKHISAEDVRASEAVLRAHMPGIEVKDFLAFLELADKDKDHKLDRKELFDGLAEGMKQEAVKTQQAEVAPSALLESQANVEMHRRRGSRSRRAEQEQDQEQEQEQEEQNDPVARAEGLNQVQSQLSRMRFHQIFSSKVANMLQRKGLNLNDVVDKVKSFVKDKASRMLDKLMGKSKDEGCVMCQYIIQRCEANVKISGVVAFLETESAILSPSSSSQPQLQLQEVPAVPLSDPDASPVLIETQASSSLENKAKWGFDETAAAATIAAAHMSTRQMRQSERARFNELYRVVDLTLDDVCEQGMPPTFYGYCKQIYKMQVQVVNGLRYQYRPTDICLRIGACTKKNYIAKGKHSRYKSK